MDYLYRAKGLLCQDTFVNGETRDNLVIGERICARMLFLLMMQPKKWTKSTHGISGRMVSRERT